MKEFFNRYQIIILRVGGTLMLLIAFAMYFWTTPKEGLTQNERAAANVARMEAKAAGGTSSKRTKTSSSTEIMKAYKDTQAAQTKYALIFIMILGIGFLGYSFVRKKDV